MPNFAGIFFPPGITKCRYVDDKLYVAIGNVKMQMKYQMWHWIIGESLEYILHPSVTQMRLLFRIYLDIDRYFLPSS